MKILIVTHYFLPHKGGIEFVAYNQAKELVKQGHEVTVVSSRIGDEPKEEVMDGIKIKRIKAWNWFERKWGVPYPIFSPKIFSILKREAKDADIVHVHDIFYLSSFAGARASKKNKKPLILMEHVELVKTKRWFVNFIQKLVYLTYGKYVMNKSKKILVCNNNVKNWFKGISQDKVILVYNGVDTTLFKPTTKENKIKLRKKYNLPLNKPIIIFAGRFVEKKGFDKVFDARDKNYLTLLIGEGIVPDYMKKDKDVLFFDAMSQNELSKFYQLSDLFVLPSVNEGFPLTILEAMSCGLPIITTDHEGYKDYLNENFVELIKPTTNELKKSINKLLKNSELKKKMENYSRKEAVNKFGWDKNVKQLLKIYWRVLNEHIKNKKTKAKS